MKRTNAQWLENLRSTGLAQAEALTDLRATIIKGLPFALSNWLSPTDPLFEAFIEEVTQETVMRVLDRLDSFEGRSQFTTWVYKIAVRVALTELRRRRWKDVSLDEMTESDEGEASQNMMTDSTPSPESVVERSDLIAHVQHMMQEELTPKQLQAMMATGVKGVPLEEVARRMDMNRNALYKLLHDGRVRLKQRLEREGLSLGELRATFETR
jgi:RNA polymerase sigma-70 factor (ECF subfamily)